MDKYDIQKLRELPIEGVAKRLGLDVKKHSCLCPFHDDHTPSLRFSASKNTFKCFVCDAHGGVIDLAMKKLDKPFADACHWLANENNIILSEVAKEPPPKEQPKRQFDASKYLRFFEHPWLNDAAIRFLYQKRKLNPKVIQWCKLNSYRDRNGTNWLQVPYYDTEGQLIGVQSRNLDYKNLSAQEKEKSSRFKFPYGSKCPIYNLPVLKLLKPNEPLYITEGASDCWAMLSAGHKAIAIPSATLLRKKDIELLGALNLKLGTPIPLHMYPDQDIPGEKLYIQLVQIATQIGSCFTRHSLPHDCKDFSDYYVKYNIKTKEQ